MQKQMSVWINYLNMNGLARLDLETFASFEYLDKSSFQFSQLGHVDCCTLAVTSQGLRKKVWFE